MRRVLGLDASLTRTGMTLGSARNIERCTHAATGPDSPNTPALVYRGRREERIGFIVVEVMCLYDSAPPDVVVFEDYAHNQRTASTTLGELGGALRHELWKRGVRFFTVPSTTVKKYATGDGRASKDDMIAAALPMWLVDNDDEADSLHICRWGSEHYDQLFQGESS